MDEIAALVVYGVRFLVAGAFVLSVIVALTHWGVRRGTLSAFGGWARFTRQWSDPILRPLERRIVRSGGNPHDAALWLVGITVVGGLVLIGLMNWLIEVAATMVDSARGGSLVVIVLHYTFSLLRLAIMVRVIASWLALSPYSRLMRVVNGLTDWLVEPIRRILPPIGMFDFSPLVAYFVLYLAENLVMRGLL
jgi:YggT family protein